MDIDTVFAFSTGLLIIVALTALYYIIRAWKGSSPNVDIESRIITFASMLLFGLVLVFLEAMAMYFWGGADSPGKEIFDNCIKVIPPFITLVLGYFFGSSQPSRERVKPD